MEWRRKKLYELVTGRWEDVETPYARLKVARENVCNFFRPDLGVDCDENNDMIMLGDYIYDGSGPWVARVASTAFQGNTVSKKLDWHKYRFTDQRVDGIDELDVFCQNMKDHISSVYQRGNFYDVQPQFTFDGFTTGGPLMFVEEDEETGFVMCIQTHWLTYRIFYDRYNQSEGVIVKDEWTTKKIFEKFCPGVSIEKRLEKAKDLFSQPLYNAVINGRMNERFRIWRAVFKAGDPIWDCDDFKPPVSGRFMKKKWYDVYLEDTSDKTKNRGQLMSAGYYSKPYVHWDYNKKPWESASRTPAFEAIYDNVSLQQIFKNYIDNLATKTRPPRVALDTMRGRLDFSAEGISYIKSDEWNYRPYTLDPTGDIRIQPETMEVIKQNLSRHFNLEAYRMFTDMARDVKRDLKILELAEMSGEKITQLLPTIESHESYLSQVDSRVRDIEMRAGRGPFNRLDLENIIDILEYYLGEDIKNVELQPEFIGTLRQAQQMQQALKPIQYGVAAAGEIAAVMGDPNLPRFTIKGYDVVCEALKAVNFQQKLIREFGDYRKLAESHEKAVAQDMMFAKAVELMKASKSIQSAVAPESIMARLEGSAA